MGRDFKWIGIAYAVALAVALLAGAWVDLQHPLAVALAAGVAATPAIFAFSVAFNNSSFYDAYWSAAPPPIALYRGHRARERGEKALTTENLEDQRSRKAFTPQTRRRGDLQLASAPPRLRGAAFFFGSLCASVPLW